MLTSIFSVTFLAILVSNVLATPLARDHEDDNRKNGGYGRHDCLSQEEGDDILSTWIDFFVDPVDADVAAEYLTPDFHLYSESTNSVTPGRADTPDKVSLPIATNISSFIAAQSFNDGSLNISVTAKSYACDSIAFRYQIASLSPFPVSGIDFLILERDDEGFKISTAYSEWNTVAFLLNIGQFPTPCNSTT